MSWLDEILREIRGGKRVVVYESGRHMFSQQGIKRAVVEYPRLGL